MDRKYDWGNSRPEEIIEFVAPDLNPLVLSSRINKALSIILDCGGIDGGHHKQWVLDQVVRALTENDEEYYAWLREYVGGPDGPHSYQWDIGVIP